MKYIDSFRIIEVFNKLHDNGIEYLLLRNIDNELPYSLKSGKDIDLFVKYKQIKQIDNFFKTNQFIEIKHPHFNDIFLYNIEKPKFMFNDKSNIFFDLNFTLSVKSIDAGQWIPLDIDIQKSCWNNKILVNLSEGFKYWTLSYEDELIDIICRAIFIKGEFSEKYIERIEFLLKNIREVDTLDKLKLVFFKFSPFLFELLKQKKFMDIFRNYLQFSEY